jgi:hypothetical protein
MPRIYLTSAAAVSAVDKARAKMAAAGQDTAGPAVESALVRWHGVREDVAASVGPGRVFSILRVPPDWLRKRVVGQVLALTPTMALLGAAFDGRKIETGERKATRARPGMSFPDYARRLLAMWPPVERVGPTQLRYGLELTDQQAERLRAAGGQDGARVVEWDNSVWHGPLGPVEDGDTLVCTCALHARCHRIPAAERLASAGWDVVLDGNRFEGVERATAWVQMNENELANGGSGWHTSPQGVRVHTDPRVGGGKAGR